jgi:hypothetical protein
MGEKWWSYVRKDLPPIVVITGSVPLIPAWFWPAVGVFISGLHGSLLTLVASSGLSL